MTNRDVYYPAEMQAADDKIAELQSKLGAEQEYRRALEERIRGEYWAQEASKLQDKLDASVKDCDTLHAVIDRLEVELEQQSSRLHTAQALLQEADEIVDSGSGPKSPRWTDWQLRTSDFVVETHLVSTEEPPFVKVVENPELKKLEHGPYDEVYEKGVKWLDENG